MYYVYVIKSLKDGSYYKGRTSNLVRRLKEHSDGKTQSNKVKRPFKLIYVELVNDIECAIKMEQFFKSGFGREVIKEIDS